MTTEPGLTLYADAFWISPYVFTCFVALREKGLPFAIEEVALQDGAQHKTEFRDRSITGRVPALRHGDFWLAESTAIVEYLEEAFPRSPRVLPTDVKARARARQMLSWIRSDLGALRDERSTTTMFYDRAVRPLTHAGEAAAEKLARVVKTLLPEHGGPLFGAWSIADSDLAFMLHRLILNEYELDPKVRAWADSQWWRPSVQEFVTRSRPTYSAY